MSFLVLVLVSMSLSNGIVIAAPVSTYDQKQYGDLNVQVELKDIEVVAMLNSGFLGDYGEYDYAYDYSDFTSKPSTSHITLTSVSPSPTISTTTVKPWQTWPTVSTSPTRATEVTENESIVAVKLTVDPTTSAPSSAVEESATVETPPEPKPEKMDQGSTASPAIPETNPVTETQTRVLRRCNPGIARDQRGRCRLLIRRRIETGSSILPYGIKLTSQIHRLNDHGETTEN